MSGAIKVEVNQMAKKRGSGSPIGSVHGAPDALKNVKLKNIEHLTQQLKAEVNDSDLSLNEILSKHFGFQVAGQQVEWTLKSGEVVTFTPVTITYEQVLKDTTVTFEVNGRDQELLTKESLSDLNSMINQQYLPAIGRKVSNKIDILDGSRRRARFLLEEGALNSFKMLITEAEISVSDAKELARQLQAVKEHSLREVGLRCLSLREEYKNLHGKVMTQELLANELGLSQSKISKAINAASIDDGLIKLFPDVSILSHTDYVLLNKVETKITSPLDLQSFIEVIQEKQRSIEGGLNQDDYKSSLISIIKEQIKLVEPPKQKDEVLITLADFNSKNVYARKRSKGRSFSYEFSRLPDSTQEKLDQAIRQVLSEN